MRAHSMDLRERVLRVESATTGYREHLSHVDSSQITDMEIRFSLLTEDTKEPIIPPIWVNRVSGFRARTFRPAQQPRMRPFGPLGGPSEVPVQDISDCLG